MGKNGIVADGYERAWSANIGAVRAEVEKEFAERMARAGFRERRKLRREIEEEVRRRMERKAPPWGLH